MAQDPASPFRIIPCRDGSHTLHDERAGHGMPSHVGPREASRLIYVEASRLRERLLASEEPGLPPLALWDVGMGVAANALAAIEARAALLAPQGRRPGWQARPLRITSFESDVRGLRLALDSPAEFPFLVPHHDSLEALLRDGEWRDPQGEVEWTLLEGDFFDTAARAEPPELVFWDFYSRPSCPALWSVESFERLVKACEPRVRRGLPTHLYTYSAATPVRAAMLLAGLRVGYGGRTSMKTESTEACTLPGRLARPLGEEWLAKFDRSSRRVPWSAPGTVEWDPSELRRRIAEAVAENR
jgi:queuine tRNA-ribosyltransferase